MEENKEQIELNEEQKKDLIKVSSPEIGLRKSKHKTGQ